MKNEYHKQAQLGDFIVGMTRSGRVMVMRFTRVDRFLSDYPIWEFPVETIGM